MVSSKKSIFILLFWFTFSFAFGQDCSNVFEIGQPPIFNASGLGFSFTGKVANDGDLYFRGSVNGTRKSIWKTDGTAAGTTMVIEENNTFGSNWDNFHFVDEGIFIQDDGAWLFLSSGDNQITMLPEFEERNLFSISNGVDGIYYLSGDGTIEYNTNNNNTKIIESVDSDKICQGELGVLVGSLIYFKATEEVLSVKDYLSILGYETNAVNAESIYGKYMYVSFADTSGPFLLFKNIIFNMETNEETNIPGIIQGDITHLEHNNFIYFIGSSDVAKVDPGNFALSNTIFENKFPFTEVIVCNDQLMMAAQNPNFNNELQIASIDVNTDEVNFLTDAPLGQSFLSSKFLAFDNNFYYIARENGSHVLNRYDFQAEQRVSINILSEVTGATVRHALESVQGHLVSSNRYNNLQHELAFCDDGTSSVSNQSEVSLLSVFPSPAIDHLEFSELDLSSKQVIIHNIMGSSSDKKTIDTNGILNISDLIPGFYFGTLIIDGKYRSFKFVKS